MSTATADNLGPDKHDHGADAHAHKKHVHDPEEHRHFEDQTTRSREKQQSLGLFSSIREALTATDPADRAHDIILKDVRRNIQRTLGGNTATLRSRVTDFEKASRQKEFHGAHGKVRAFFRWISGKGYENHYLHEQYPEGMTHHDVDDAAEMDVKKPVVFDAERIWRQRFDENSAAFAALSDPDKKEIQDTKKLLKKKLGDKAIDEMEDYPEMTATLGYLFELKRRNPAMRLNTFVTKALGITDDKPTGALDAAETKESLEKIKHSMDEMKNTVHEMGDEDFLGKIQEARQHLHHAKHEEEEAANAIKDPSKLAGVRDTSIFSHVHREKKADLEKAQKHYEHLLEMYDKFRKQCHEISSNLKILAPKVTKSNPAGGPDIPDEEKSHRIRKTGADNKFFLDIFETFAGDSEGLDHKVKKITYSSDTRTSVAFDADIEKNFKEIFKLVSDGTVARNWKKIKGFFEEDVAKLEKSEAKMKEQKDVVSEHMSPVELMYKIHYHSKTTKVSEGGEMPDASPLNDIQKRRIRYDSLLFARYYMIEAKDQSTFVKNQIRLKEIYRKSGLFRRIESFPKLDTMLKRLRVLEVPKKGEDGKTEKPFAELVLRGKMTQTDLRMALSHKQIKPDHLPLLVAHLEAILNGERGKHIRYEDLRPLTNLITNLKILRQEHLHNKFKGEIAKKPGSFSDKITALWKNDFEAEDALATEYHEAIDKDALFENIRDAHWYQLSRQAPYEKKLRELKEQMKEKMTKENWSRGKVVEFLKKNGVPAAAAVATGLALAYSAKKLGKKIASKLPQTAGEKAGTVKEAGILRKIGYQATRPFRFVGNKVVTPLAKLTIGTPIKYGVLYPAKGLAKLAGLGKKGLVTSGKFVANLPKETWKGAKKFVVSDTKKAASATGDFFKSFFKSGGGGGHGGHGGGHH